MRALMNMHIMIVSRVSANERHSPTLDACVTLASSPAPIAERTPFVEIDVVACYALAADGAACVCFVVEQPLHFC